MKMNLKETLKNLTDEELGELLNEIVNRQLEKAKEKEESDHHYVFTGTWEWDVWAKSKEEAVECFEESCPEEFNICTDEYEVEQYE